MKTFGWIVAGILGLMALGFVGTLMNVISLPGRVISTEVGTNRAIGNYEWFFEYNTEYQSSVAQIKSYLNNPDIQSIEIEAARSSCRNLANAYNAEGMKINKKWFKDSQLPDTLDATQCELQKETQ